MGNINHRHIGVIGATSVERGYTGDQILEAIGKDKVWMIVLGKLIADKMSHDVGFREKYGETVQKGGLLPYEVVTPMVEKSYQDGIKANYEIFFWDGYGQDEKQAKKLLEIWGVPDIIKCTDYRFFMLRASKTTCGRHHDEVLETIEKCRGYVKIIDANKPPETFGKSVLISCRQIVDRFKGSIRFENTPQVTARTRSSSPLLVPA